MAVTVSLPPSQPDYIPWNRFLRLSHIEGVEKMAVSTAVSIYLSQCLLKQAIHAWVPDYLT